MPFLSHTCYMPRPTHSFLFNQPSNIGWEVQIIKHEAVRQLTSRKLMIHLGRKFLKYTHWVWYPHETGKANKNVSRLNL
jgi:hypothetical protein